MNYREPALSALPPSIVKRDDGYTICVEVRNFGQVASKPAPLRIMYDRDGQEVRLASGKVPALAPFEKSLVELPCGNILKPGVSYKTSVIIHPDGQRPVTLQRTLDPANETR